MINVPGCTTCYHGDDAFVAALRPSPNTNVSANEPELNNTPQLEPNYYVFVFTLILLFLVVIGNSVTIFIFTSSRKLFNETALCLVNLAVADFLTGVFYLPMSLVCSLNGECIVASNRPLCLSVVIVSYTCYGASACTLTLVSIDRCLKISHPLRYHTIVTKTRIAMCLTLIWAASFTLPCCFILTNPHIIQFDVNYYQCGLQAHYEDALAYTYVTNFLIFFVPVPVMTVCSVRILVIAFQARTQIANQEAAVGGREARRGSARSRHSRASDMRVTVRVFIVVVAFIVCFLPFNIQMFHARRWSSMFPNRLSLLAVMMVEINSAINPIVYVTTYATFRHVIANKLLSCCFQSRRHNSVVWSLTRPRSQDQALPSASRMSTKSITAPEPNRLRDETLDDIRATREERCPFLCESPPALQ
ncbi:adenosine receptor A3-like [Diadema antillarum]|uniref:adenosine receptor A3-like n=1 Tax=Diadema antillarum TaxID=105358 RepID=UPI003A85E2AE